MFDKLIESEPKGADFKDRRKYFLVSSVVVGILFTTAVVVSIYAADYGIGVGNLELVEMIAPVAPDPVEPKIREPRPQTASASTSQNAVASRQINMARVDEPTIAPASVSTIQNSQLARPATGRYRFDGFDRDTGDPNGSGRETGRAGQPGSSLGDQVAASAKSEEPEETAPPAAIKKPQPSKLPVSGGVMNGKATVLPRPNYPATARNVGASGEVVVQVIIDESGRVTSANAVRGHILLRPEAERAARGARFSPTRLSDVPVKVTGVITYNFTK